MNLALTPIFSACNFLATLLSIYIEKTLIEVFLIFFFSSSLGTGIARNLKRVGKGWKLQGQSTLKARNECLPIPTACLTSCVFITKKKKIEEENPDGVF